MYTRVNYFTWVMERLIGQFRNRLKKRKESPAETCAEEPTPRKRRKTSSSGQGPKTLTGWIKKAGQDHVCAWEVSRSRRERLGECNRCSFVAAGLKHPMLSIKFQEGLKIMKNPALPVLRVHEWTEKMRFPELLYRYLNIEDRCGDIRPTNKMYFETLLYRI